MPIEFSCANCERLLRTPDNTAGKQARCPECGTIVPIPEPSPPEPAGPVFQTTADDPFGRPPSSAGPLIPQPPPPPPHGDPQNPYRSPLATEQGLYLDPTAAALGGRTGPAWERDGKSFGSFFRTLQDNYSVSEFFRTMRREGGSWNPLLYTLISGTFCWVIWGIIQVGLQSVGFALEGAGEIEIGVFLAIMVGVVVLAPFFIVLWLYLNSALIHLFLGMVGGANQPFETTFRVVCYAAGSTAPIQLVPCIGGFQPIVEIVFTVIGIQEAHETTGGKAAAAVILPKVFCCLAAVGGIVALVAAIIAAAQA